MAVIDINIGGIRWRLVRIVITTPTVSAVRGCGYTSATTAADTSVTTAEQARAMVIDALTVVLTTPKKIMSVTESPTDLLFPHNNRGGGEKSETELGDRNGKIRDRVLWC